MGVERPSNLPQTIPAGHVATIITHLEMLDKPALSEIESILSLEEWPKPPVVEYLDLFRAVGEPWFWTSRILMAEDEVRAVIQHPDINIYIIRYGEESVGFIELDFRQTGQCEIGFFGLVPEMNGKGHGGWMMNQALKKAWRDDVERVWLHTCIQDSPRALPFYQRCGFRIFKQQFDMMPDPRLSGQLPTTAARHVPILI